VDAGPQARKLINAIKWIGEEAERGFRPLPFVGGMIIFPGIIGFSSRIGVSIGYPGR
jgi:hypothetical protein